MKRYIPRAFWYLSVVVLALSVLYFPTKFLINGYLSAAIVYLPLSIFFVLVRHLMPRKDQVNEVIFGSGTSVVSLTMIALGMAFCIAYAIIDRIYLAQFGVMSLLIGTDIALLLRDRRCGGKKADRSQCSEKPM